MTSIKLVEITYFEIEITHAIQFKKIININKHLLDIQHGDHK